MPYPQDHLYLTVHWIDDREPDEHGQFGIRFQGPTSEVSQSMVDAAKPIVETFWKSAGAKIPATYRLASLRLALIGANGQYVPGTFSRDAIYNPVVGGTSHMAAGLPMQVASAVTLTTEAPRGQASKGRCFLPPLQTPIQGDGRWLVSDVNARAAAFATMLSSLNASTAFSGAGLPVFAAVFSKGTTKNVNGAYEFVRGVKIGTRPDIQRRRAKGQAELYGTTSAVTGPTP